jgi:hypothetical protein
MENFMRNSVEPRQVFINVYFLHIKRKQKPLSSKRFGGFDTLIQRNTSLVSVFGDTVNRRQLLVLFSTTPFFFFPSDD